MPEANHRHRRSYTAGVRIGILGGTFDPVHIAHLVVAVEARSQLGLDQVLLVVAHRPWQKDGFREIAPAEHRLAMVRLAVEDLAGVEASAIEIDRGGPTYSVDTLDELHRCHPGAPLFLIVGADAAATLPTWHDAARLRELATLVVVNRPGAGAEVPPGWPHEHVLVPSLEVSSTDVRARVARGRPIDVLVPPAVVRYIADHGLYADAG